MTAVVSLLPNTPAPDIFLAMSTVAEIKEALAKLTLEERAEILTEFCGWSDDDWDRQMKADATAGKFDALNREADAAQASGKTVPLDDILREA